VVPDTVFGISRLLVDFRGAPSPEFQQLAEAHSLKSPYIVFQPNLGFEGLMRVRSLIRIGADAATYPDNLSIVWQTTGGRTDLARVPCASGPSHRTTIYGD
jgi:hypothetical protein